MATCPTCATPLPAGAVFCPRCGASTPTEISGERAATTVRAPAPAPSKESAERRAGLQRALGPGFELKDLIGQGGFGEVWAATDVKLKRDVAVKVLREELVASPALLERFHREAEAAAKLRHPNIVPIYQVGEAEALVFFVMPLIKGESLRALLEREGRVEVAEALRILTEAASALHEAHRVGIVHRDIKPDNILLEGPERRVLLMDFGIAKSLEPGEGGLTGTGMVIGTPQYMSPEQATGEKQIDARSDVYSLGVVAYQMLAGRLPFEAESAQGMIVAHITAAPDPIEKARTGVPEELAAAVMRALAKKPAERFGSAVEFADAARPSPSEGDSSPLRWAVRGLGLSARRARTRAVWYGTVLASLVLYLSLVKADWIREATRFWVRSASAPDPSYGGSVHGLESYIGPQLFVYRDSMIGVVVPEKSGFAVGLFDGTSWQRIQAPAGGFYVPLVFSLLDTLFVVDGYALPPDTSLVWLLESGRFRLAGTVNAMAQSLWAGRSDVALWSPGTLAWRGPQGWRVQPLEGALYPPFGNRMETLRSWRGDSILSHVSPFWKGADPRPDTSRSWRYEAGSQLPNGVSVVVGVDCPGSSSSRWYPQGNTSCSPLLLKEDSPGGEWRREGSDLPRSFRPQGVCAVSDDEILIWGSHIGPAFRHSALYGGTWGGYSMTPVPRGQAAAFSIVRGRATPILSGVPIAQVVLLQGNPYALLTDGSLWARLRGVWGHLTDVPGLRVVSADAFEGTRNRRWSGAVGDGVFRGSAESDSASWRAAYPPVGDRAIEKVVALRGGLVLLAEGGRLFAYDCAVERPHGVCNTREVTPTGLPALTDVVRMGNDTLLAVGRGGVVATYALSSGRWDVADTPGLAASDFTRVALAADGMTQIALASESVWRRRVGGDWERWTELPAWLRPADRVAAAGDDGVAVAGGNGKVGYFSGDTSSWSLVNDCYGGAEGLAFLGPRRLAIVGGTLRVVVLDTGDTPTAAPRGRCERVSTPPGIDLLQISIEGDYVHARGSALFHGVWDRRQLPFANPLERVR